MIEELRVAVFAQELGVAQQQVSRFAFFANWAEMPPWGDESLNHVLPSLTASLIFVSTALRGQMQ